LNILPEHYRHVAVELLGAICDVLGEAATPPICAAWNEAYWFLAETLIARESTVYSDRASRPGGWRGWRDFVVESVTLESLIIRSFVLVPKDGDLVLPHRPGQYLGLLAEIPDHGSVRRNYSISCGPNPRSYRITVKREAPEGLPAGIVSNWLHDRVGVGEALKIAPPAGDFFLDLNHSAPVVLVSGGVGLTPLMSMLEAIAASTPQRSTWYIHGALNGHVHAMAARVRALAQQAPGVRYRTFYEKPRAEDRLGHTHDEVGIIKAEWLTRHTPLREAVYFLCGPKPFLRALVGGLLGRGVPAERVRYEFFGPTDEILAAAAV
jgi:nitric oxide dioxygenase